MIEGITGGRASPLGSVRISCHETPYLSCIHPYRSLKGYLSIGMRTVPPSDSFSQAVSNFLLASFSGEADPLNNSGSKLTMKETDGLNLNSGPALIDINLCPQISKATTSQSPDGVSLITDMLLIFESGK